MTEPIFLLLAADVTVLSEEALYRRAYGLVSAQRRTKAERLRFPEDRQRCIGAELLLRYGLSLLGDAFENHVYGTGEHGKPYFADTDGIRFSLSHSGDYVLCAISPLTVGCDIEKFPDAGNAVRIARRFFTAEESADIAAVSEEQGRAELFARYWTRKESVLKASGKGFSCPMNAFSVREADGWTEIGRLFSWDACRVLDCDAPDGYRCALCIAGARETLPAFVPLRMTDLRTVLSAFTV